MPGAPRFPRKSAERAYAPAVRVPEHRCEGTDPDTGDRCTVRVHAAGGMCVVCLDRKMWLRGKRAARRWVSA